MVGRDTAEEKRAVGHTSLTVAVSDEGVEEEHGDPRGDDEGGGEAVEPPLPPVSGSLRHRALLLRRRRPPQKGPPRPLHSFPALPVFPHIRDRKPHPPARQGLANPADPEKQRSEIRSSAASGARRRRPGTEAAETRPRGTGRGMGCFETAGAPSQGETKREAFMAFVLFCARSCLLRLPVGSVNRPAAMSVQPVLRWISSIAWILRVVYSFQSNMDTSFGFEIQILDDPSNYKY